jgi:hypothetical protein
LAQDPEQGFLSQLIAEAVEYLHGRARKQVVRQLTAADNLSETMSAITYKLARGLLEKHKKQGMSMDIDMGLAMGLATEVIDMQIEMVERVAPERLGTDPQKLREDTLLRTMMMHAEQLKDDPAAQEEAQQLLRAFMQDGSADQAFSYVNQRAAQEGQNVEDMIRAGDSMARQVVGGGQRPVAAGVQQGMGAPAPQGLMSAPPQ